jgi:hypothetical protein
VTRDILPTRRSSVNFTLEFQGERYDVTTGFYNDNRFGEIFINRVRDKSAAKLGQQLEATCRDVAIVMSLALQHGVDLADLKHSITRDDDGAPMSIVGAIVDSVNPKEPPDDGRPALVRPGPRDPGPSPQAAEEAPAKAGQESPPVAARRLSRTEKEIAARTAAFEDWPFED